MSQNKSCRPSVSFFSPGAGLRFFLLFFFFFYTPIIFKFSRLGFVSIHLGARRRLLLLGVFFFFSLNEDFIFLTGR